MKFSEISDNSPNYVKGMFYVMGREDARPSKYGFCQMLVLEDDDGVQVELPYYPQTENPEEHIGTDWIGTYTKFRVRLKNDNWQCNPAGDKGEIVDKPIINKVVYGKCKSLLLGSCVAFEGLPAFDSERAVLLRKRINKWVDWEMS